MATQELGRLCELALPADQRRRLHGQVRLVKRPERREVCVTKLVEPLRRAQVLKPVLAEVSRVDLSIDEVTRGLREQYLPTVAGGRDPRCAMDVDTNIAFVGDERLASVNPDPNAHRRGLKRLLRLARS
jgi:hypothetical protein